MKRRDFIRTIGVLSAFQLLSLGTRQRAALAEERDTVTAHAHTPGQITAEAIEDDFKYRGRRVKVVRQTLEACSKNTRSRTANPRLALLIDGKDVGHHVFSEIENGYASHMFPYQTFRRPRDLARQLIDQDGCLFVL